MFNRNRRIWKKEIRKALLGDQTSSRDRFSKRYYRLWRASLADGRSPLRDASPWITYSAIDLVEGYLAPEMRVFEYGGGGSTLFFVQRVSNVITVEHDEKWFTTIQAAIEADSRKNWQGLLKPAQEGCEKGGTIADPDAYRSNHPDFKGYSFRDYASAIDAFPDDSFDVVLVDGRARPSCLKHALPKIKPSGLLVLDNSDRDYYLELTLSILAPQFELLLDGKAPTPYLKWFTQTTVWRKR